MCGRFVSVSPPDEVARYFGADGSTEVVLEPSYNVAPTDDVYVVYQSGDARRLDTFHWGLVPFWAKDPSVGNRMINARAEGLAAKGAYRNAFAKQRCLIPADGFYEWQRVPGRKQKQPYFVHRSDDEPMAFAALWERWRGPDGPDRSLRSCTIVTTKANETMEPIHDRMPVVLPPAVWDEWLDPDGHDTSALEQLLVPAPPRIIAVHPVSTAVGNVANNRAELLEPVDPALADDGGLFSSSPP